MQLSLATRIFLGFALLVATFGAVSAYSVVTLHGVGEDIRVVSQTHLPLTTVTAQVEAFQKSRARDLTRLVDEKDRVAQRALIRLARLYYPAEMHKRIGAGRALLARALPGSPEGERPFLLEVDRAFAELDQLDEAHDQRAEALFDLLLRDDVPAEASDLAARDLSASQADFERALRRLGGALDARVSLRVANASADERRGAWAVVAASLGAILLGLGVTLGALRLLRPIRRLTERAARIGRAPSPTESPRARGDEVALLVREFDGMEQALEAQKAALAEQQEALLRAERLAAMGRVTAQIAHEVRNPLSAMSLDAEMLGEAIDQAAQGDEAARTEVRELSAAISREIDRLTGIVEQYLAFARGARLQLQPEDVRAVAAAAFEFQAPELQRAGLKFEQGLGEVPLWAEADAGQLRQALLNLLRNAREALQPLGHGTVKLLASATPNRIRLEVVDDGPGMPPELVARIGEPFLTTRPRGTGLGLAITRQIAREHGGELTCHAAPGAGTRFVLELPRAEPPRAS